MTTIAAPSLLPWRRGGRFRPIVFGAYLTASQYGIVIILWVCLQGLLNFVVSATVLERLFLLFVLAHASEAITTRYLFLRMCRVVNPLLEKGRTND